MVTLHTTTGSRTPSANDTFEQVLQARISRRGMIGGGVAVAATAALASGGVTGVDSLLRAVPAARPRPPRAARCSASKASTCPPPTRSWCHPATPHAARLVVGRSGVGRSGVRAGREQLGRRSGRQWGMHNDGVVYFPIVGSLRGLLVQNNEYADDGLLFPDGIANWDAEKTAKSMAAHGVSIVEIFGVLGRWRVRRPSRYGRRITAATPIDIVGPAAGDPCCARAPTRPARRCSAR